MSTARVIKGAAAFGVVLKLDDDDALTYDAYYEPSESILARIRGHEPAIVSLLKARQTAAAIQWDRLNDLDGAGYEALRHIVVTEIETLQLALSKLEGAAAAILPQMQEHSRTWGAAVEALLAAPYNARYANRRPKGYSDAEWAAALYQARLIGSRGPQKSRKVTR